MASKSFLFLKAASNVCDGEFDRLLRATEMHREAPNSTVLHSVLQRLLQNSKQAKRDFLGQGARYARVAKLNLNFILFRQFLAETIGGGGETQIFKLGGMQTMG